MLLLLGPDGVYVSHVVVVVVLLVVDHDAPLYNLHRNYRVTINAVTQSLRMGKQEQKQKEEEDEVT